jgi:hypothetical protein
VTVDPRTANRVPAERKLRRSFIGPGELVSLRTLVIRVPQTRLVEQLVDPCTGEPVTRNALSHWERGTRPVPLWVARRVRDLAEAARAYDAKALERKGTSGHGA